MPDDSADDLDADRAPLPGGWVHLGPHNWSTTLLVQTSFTGIIGGYLALSIAIQVARDLPLPAAIALGVLTIAVIWAGVIVAVNLRFPQAWVNFDTGEIRTGRRTAPFAQIDLAWLFPTPTRKTRMLTLRFGVAKGPQVVIRLRDAKDQPVDSETARLVLEVLRRSTVRMPESKDDPTGRFARYNFPGISLLKMPSTSWNRRPARTIRFPSRCETNGMCVTIRARNPLAGTGGWRCRRGSGIRRARPARFRLA